MESQLLAGRDENRRKFCLGHLGDAELHRAYCLAALGGHKGLLTFALNVTLDGCCDHREMVANDEMLRYWTRVMDAAGAMLFGRRTYELMEDAWPQVARDPKATPSNRDWAKKLEAKPKYVVSTTGAWGR